MIAIHRAEPTECLWIVAHKYPSHLDRHRNLPSVIFAHAMLCPTLNQSGPCSVIVVQTLPS